MNSEKIEILRTSLIITQQCTLKCTLCANYSPYYHPAVSFTKDQLYTTIDRFFSSVDHVGDWSFSGGEPVLHADLSSLIRYANCYNEQFDKFLLLTNATILPKEDVLEAMKDCGNKFQVNISNYGPDKSKCCNALKNILSEHNIQYREIVYYGEDVFCKGWVDLRDLNKKYFTEEELIKHSEECIKHSEGQCFVIYGDQMHNCPRSYRCMELGITPRDPNEYVDFGDNGISNEQRRERIQSMLTKKYMASCAYCAGFSPDSPRFKPAEQLPLDYKAEEDDHCYNGGIAND